MSLELWAPPNIDKSCLHDKIEEWQRLHPNTHPYARFIQDYIDSCWPVLWHLKRKFVLHLDRDFDDEDLVPELMCAICRNDLGLGSETMSCGHLFHTMCIHRWLQRQTTCPLCRASL